MEPTVVVVEVDAVAFRSFAKLVFASDSDRGINSFTDFFSG
jgi:hypothetical protein